MPDVFTTLSLETNTKSSVVGAGALVMLCTLILLVDGISLILPISLLLICFK